MALRSRRIPLPPSTGNADEEFWMRQVTEAFNALPLSYFSTADGPNSSNVTAPQGFIGIEIGSSTTKLWVKTSGSTSIGWSALSTI